MRIGVFGGTFDPPHLGHMILAAEACDQLRLDKVLWVLTALPPHKRVQVILPVEARLALLKAALEKAERFEVSRVDIDRPGPHYALDTVRLLKKQYPDDDIVYLLGGDSLRDLPIWYESRKFVKECSGLGVMRRPGDDIDFEFVMQAIPGVGEKIAFIDAPLLEISSREIRERIARGGTFRYYLLEAVYEIIQKKGYYR